MGKTAGQTIGPYILREPLGMGASGSLWLAENYLHTLNHKVVVKVVNAGVESLDEVLQQAKTWAQVNAQQHIVPLVEVGVYDEQLIVVTEFMPDGSLAEKLRRNGGQPFAPADAVATMLDVLTGLQELHRRGVIYCNLNPSKILFAGQTAHLLSLSLASVTDTYASVETNSMPRALPYISPEAISGVLSKRNDLWSAGVILYQMLAGRVPFAQPDLVSCFKAIIGSDPPLLPEAVPLTLRQFVAKALEKKKVDRFQSSVEMLAALEALALNLFANQGPGAESVNVPPPHITQDRTNPDAVHTFPGEANKQQEWLPLAPGSVLQGRYEIIELLTRGGMGCVYRARHLRLRHTLAIKENLFTDTSEQFIRLFEQEGTLLANLQHPQLPRVQDFFVEDGRSFFVMDFVEGQSLEEWLRQSGGALAEGQIVDAAIHVCRVLEYLHSQRPPVIHCDIKPHNIFITPQGVVKLLDLGIAQLLTETAKASADAPHAFTPGFAAPEQWDGRAGPRSDIFGLGATIYYLLTGTTIRAGHEAFVFHEAPWLRSVKPDVSRALAEVVSKCLRRDEDDRWQSARELREALEAMRGSAGKSPDPPRRDEYDVFISYRRQSGSSEARLIRAVLREHDIRVFLDVEDLGAGHFDQALLNRITETPNFIVVLSPNCLERCADERDWLRQEIVQAIKTNRKIIPIYLPGFEFPYPQDMPEPLRTLISHQGIRYSHEYFNAMIEKIERYLKQH
jgi:serine/threonine protein kinase